MDLSFGNTPELKSNVPSAARNSTDADDQEIILQLNSTIRSKIVENFSGHIRALEANGELAANLKTNLLSDNKLLVLNLIDLPVTDRQRRSTVEFRLEFSLRNRVLANIAKNNLFIRDSKNVRFNRQFKTDLIDENNLLIAFLNSLEVDQPTNGARGERGIYLYGFILVVPLVYYLIALWNSQS